MDLPIELVVSVEANVACINDAIVRKGEVIVTFCRVDRHLGGKRLKYRFKYRIWIGYIEIGVLKKLVDHLLICMQSYLSSLRATGRSGETQG